MTVGQLKRILAAAPDDAIILTTGSDHSYSEVSAQLVDVATPETPTRRRSKDYFEWYGNQADFDLPVKVVKAIVFG